MAIRHRQRFILIMGYVDDRGTKSLLQTFDLELHGLSQFLVEGAKWFIHQKDGWLEGQSPRHGDPLLLATGKLVGIALRVAGELDEFQHLLDALHDRGLVHPPTHPERKCDVLVDRQVRKKRVFLEHHSDVPVIWRKKSHVLATDGDPAGARSLKAGYHRQGCCLAGAGRPQQRDKFPGCDVERQLANRKGFAVSFLKSRKGQRLTDQIRLSFQLLDALRRLPLETAASGRNEKPSSDPGRVRTMRLLPRFLVPRGPLVAGPRDGACESC